MENQNNIKLGAFTGTFLLSFLIQLVLYEILVCLQETESQDGFVFLAIIISVLYSLRVFINTNESNN